MKRVCLITAAVLVMGWFAPALVAQCTTIQDGTLLDAIGDPITTGYDDWGYNYQAQIFNGRYCDSDRVEGGAYCDVDLLMKWNTDWLSNKSCDADYLLDRHFGSATYIGSGAWLTNHQSGKVEVNGKLRKWTYFIKIIAVPGDATAIGGFWYDTGDIEIGPVIWGEFAIVEEVLNDPSTGDHGILYKSPAGPGLGNL